MWKATIVISLVSEEGSALQQESQIEIQEEIPGGFGSLEEWEQAVRQIGFKGMRKLFPAGIEMLEKQVLHDYTHQGSACELVKRGKVDLGLSTVFGKVFLKRQQLYCKTCQAWVKPLNEALGLHGQAQGRTTLGFKELVSLCVVNQPYRLAHKMVADLTQDAHVISFRQMKNIVDTPGQDLRKQQDQSWRQVSFDVIRSIQDRRMREPVQEGKLYICLDGILVHSNQGRGRWREGKVGLICTEEREPVGKKGRQAVTNKRYVASFEPSEIFGSWVYSEAVQMGFHDYEDVILLGDGARWIRILHAQAFRRARYILDGYHLKEKVYPAFKLTFPEDADLRRSLRKQVTDGLWKGEKQQALEMLEEIREELLSEGLQELVQQREGLQVLIAYIRNNWAGIVAYRHMHKQGYLVASSLVEKAADVVVAKRQKKRQGMHWSHPGAEGVSGLRTLWLNEDWGAYWQQKRQKNVA